MPASVMAFILSAAVPCPPLMISSSVAHAAAWRRGLTGDEAYYGLFHMFFDEGCCGFFGRAANLADHDDGFGVWVIVQQAQRVDVRCADDGIAANS